MNKTQLVDCIQAKLGEGATKKCAETALNAVLGAIKDAVATEKVQLVGFGTFEMKTRAARTGRNPQTGAAMKITNINIMERSLLIMTITLFLVQEQRLLRFLQFALLKVE